MPSAVLVIGSTRAPQDVQEILRIQDTVAALLEEGHAVDLLVPAISPLLSVALANDVRLFRVPEFPFCGNPPPHASIRRLILGILMSLRGIALASSTNYAVFHGVNDGSIIARVINNFSLRNRPCVAEFHVPFALPCFSRGIRTAIARFLERHAFRRAAAVILPDVETLAHFSSKLSRARVTIIPDPHSEISPDAFTIAEFTSALAHVYDYILRPRNED